MLYAAPWCSGLTRLPVKEEIGSSNLLGVATSFLTRLLLSASVLLRSMLVGTRLDSDGSLGAADRTGVDGAVSDDVRRAIDEVADLVCRSEYVVAMTGAGMSVESGIPPFRGSDGLWTRFGRPSMDGFREFKADPQAYWERQLNAEFDAHILHLRDRLQRAVPHAGHQALARLVRDGWVRSVVTQNIDGLDARAGLAAERLIEVHGNRKRLRCIECGARTDLDDFVPLFAPGPCRDCGGAVKFDAVMFGEPLVPEVLAAARAEFDRADCVLAIGTSATVRPASGLIWVATHRRDSEGQNAVLVEINPNATKATAISDIVVRAEAGVALPLLERAIAARGSRS